MAEQQQQPGPLCPARAALKEAAEAGELGAGSREGAEQAGCGRWWTAPPRPNAAAAGLLPRGVGEPGLPSAGRCCLPSWVRAGLQAAGAGQKGARRGRAFRGSWGRRVRGCGAGPCLAPRIPSCLCCEQKEGEGSAGAGMQRRGERAKEARGSEAAGGTCPECNGLRGLPVQSAYCSSPLPPPPAKHIQHTDSPPAQCCCCVPARGGVE